jgi:predicted amidohydrolase
MSYEQGYSLFSKSIRVRKVAAVQMNVAFSNVGSNVQTVVRHLGNLAKHKVDLVVFPEAALTGYCFDDLESALQVAIDSAVSSPVVPTPLDQIQNACDLHNIIAVVGFAEKSGTKLFNSVALFEPGEPRKIYRKTHLPFLGMDRFATPGDELVVWDCSVGKVAPLICFDLRPPEAARTLALDGAEILLVPTNWPEGAENSAEHTAIARAYENHVFVITCNRVGTENGFRFIGKSKIIHASGKVLAAAEAFEVVLIAEIDPSESNRKRVVNIPGAYEVEVLNCRRSNLYRL